VQDLPVETFFSAPDTPNTEKSEVSFLLPHFGHFSVFISFRLKMRISNSCPHLAQQNSLIGINDYRMVTSSCQEDGDVAGIERIGPMGHMRLMFDLRCYS
jgi:hypothetical protein